MSLPPCRFSIAVSAASSSISRRRPPWTACCSSLIVPMCSWRAGRRAGRIVWASVSMCFTPAIPGWSTSRSPVLERTAGTRVYRLRSHRSGCRRGNVRPGGAPGRSDLPRLSLCVTGAAHLAVMGALAALHRREQDGAGRHVCTSLVDGALAYNSMMWGETDQSVAAQAATGGSLPCSRQVRCD